MDEEINASFLVPPVSYVCKKHGPIGQTSIEISAHNGPMHSTTGKRCMFCFVEWLWPLLDVGNVYPAEVAKSEAKVATGEQPAGPEGEKHEGSPC